jgi:hypothetical protein
MFSKPLACSSTLDRRPRLARTAGFVLRGGALEPNSRFDSGKIAS